MNIGTLLAVIALGGALIAAVFQAAAPEWLVWALIALLALAVILSPFPLRGKVGIALLLPMLLFSSPVLAAEPCGSTSSLYSPGKTEEGFSAKATDGCHSVDWTSNTVDSSDSGSLTFHTVGNIQPWERGYTLPGPEQGFCKYRAAHEANGWFTNHFKVPVGTSVTVQYRCY